MAKLVNKTYGDALFQVALENNKIEEYYQEINCVYTALLENDDMFKFFNHPKISKDEKIKVVENVFKGRVADDITGFLVLMLRKDRQEMIKETLDYFIGKVKEYKKIGTALFQFPFF